MTRHDECQRDYNCRKGTILKLYHYIPKNVHHFECQLVVKGKMKKKKTKKTWDIPKVLHFLSQKKNYLRISSFLK